MPRKSKVAAEAVNGNTALQNTYPVDVKFRGGGIFTESHKVRRVVLNESQFNEVVTGKLKKALLEAGFDWVDKSEDGIDYNEYHEGAELQFHLLIKMKRCKTENDAPGQTKIGDPEAAEDEDSE